MADLTHDGRRASPGRARSPRPGSGRPTWPCAQLYDAFTITPILFLEDLGFCAKGEGGAFVEDGRIAPGRRAAGQHERRRASPTGTRGCTGCSRWSRPSARVRGGRRRRRRGARQRRRPLEPGHGRPRRRGDRLRRRRPLGDPLGSRPWTSSSPTSSASSADRARVHRPRGRPGRARDNARDAPLRHRPRREDRRPGLPRRDRPARVRRRRAGLPHLRRSSSRRSAAAARRCAPSSRCRPRSSARRSCAGAPRSRSSATCRKLCSGEWLGCFGLTEPDTGSDAANQKTRAIARIDGGWVINGAKMWISLGNHARLRARLRPDRSGRSGTGASPASSSTPTSPASSAAGDPRQDGPARLGHRVDRA